MPIVRVRISDRMDEMLRELEIVFGLTKTELIRSLVREKYEKIDPAAISSKKD